MIKLSIRIFIIMESLILEFYEISELNFYIESLDNFNVVSYDIFKFQKDFLYCNYY